MWIAKWARNKAILSPPELHTFFTAQCSLPFWVEISLYQGIWRRCRSITSDRWRRHTWWRGDPQETNSVLWTAKWKGAWVWESQFTQLPNNVKRVVSIGRKLPLLIWRVGLLKVQRYLNNDSHRPSCTSLNCCTILLRITSNHTENNSQVPVASLVTLVLYSRASMSWRCHTRVEDFTSIFFRIDVQIGMGERYPCSLKCVNGEGIWRVDMGSKDVVMGRVYL